MALHYSICEIFQLSGDIQVIFRMDRYSEFPETKEVDNMFGMLNNDDDESNEQFFENIKIKNYAKITPTRSFVLRPENPLFSTTHLAICNPYRITRDHLCNFRGTSLTLHVANGFSTEDLIAFVENWIKGSNIILKSVMILCDSHFSQKLERKRFFEAFNAKAWDPERRAARFEYPPT